MTAPTDTKFFWNHSIVERIVFVTLLRYDKSELNLKKQFNGAPANLTSCWEQLYLCEPSRPGHKMHLLATAAPGAGFNPNTYCRHTVPSSI